MKKTLKWIGIGAGCLVGAVALFVGTMVWSYSRAMDKEWAVDEVAVRLSTDPAVLARGEHVARAVAGCTDCHGEDLSGGTVIDEPPMGRITAPNLTKGEGGVAGRYSDGQLARAIRHGVGADGKSLAFMPSKDYFWLPDDDLSALVSWIRSVPPVDGAPPPIALGVLPRVLDRLDAFALDAAGRIDHEGPRPAVPAPSAEPEYGRFLAISCSGCHGESFTGGPIPGAPPSLPAASNLTRHGDGLASWSRADFATALRQGVRPDGSAIDPFMPVKVTKHLSDEEVSALWAYFGSLPPGATGT